MENDEDSNVDEEEEDFDMTHHTPLTVTFSPVSRGECCEILGIQSINYLSSKHYFPRSP